MKRLPALFLLIGLLLASCSPTPSPSNDIPEAYRDRTNADWTYQAPQGTVQPLAISTDDSTWNFVTTAKNSWGPIERNMSNGESAAGDGHALTMDGHVFQYGLGLHATAEFDYSPTQSPDKICYLSALVGIDDEVGDQGSVVFQAFANGVKLYDSGRLTGKDPVKLMSVTIPAGAALHLVVTDAGDNGYFDHADFANPVVACGQQDKTPPTIKRVTTDRTDYQYLGRAFTADFAIQDNVGIARVQIFSRGVLVASTDAGQYDPAVVQRIQTYLYNVPGMVQEAYVALKPATTLGDFLVTVLVTDTSGNQARLDSIYTVRPMPVFTGFSPKSGSALGGTTVTVTGKNFPSDGYTVAIVEWDSSDKVTTNAAGTEMQFVTRPSFDGYVGPRKLSIFGSFGTIDIGEFTYTKP